MSVEASRRSGGASLVLVTGAGSGIGRAAALAFAARGLDLVLVGRTEQTLVETAREVAIASPRVRAAVIPCDVSKSAEVTALRDRVLSELGAPLVVVNNAGMVARAAVEDTTDADWSEVLGVNLDGTFYVTRAFLPSMRARGEGRFVAVASISSTLGTPRASAYCAAKWAVVGFMKSLAEELRGTRLAAISVMPGSVDTKMLVGSGFSPAMTPDDVAGTLVYAGLDAPWAMNGSALEVFG